jgi:predicted Holliday junction resolvase-like endonuclease
MTLILIAVGLLLVTVIEYVWHDRRKIQEQHQKFQEELDAIRRKIDLEDAQRHEEEYKRIDDAEI